MPELSTGSENSQKWDIPKGTFCDEGRQLLRAADEDEMIGAGKNPAEKIIVVGANLGITRAEAIPIGSGTMTMDRINIGAGMRQAIKTLETPIKT